jgi:mycothiol synthase
MASPARTQLVMTMRSLAERTAALAAPVATGYTLRAYRPGDEPAWVEIINSVGDLGQWTLPRALSEVVASPNFDAEGLFFAVCGDHAVGTACVWWGAPGGASIGALHMVAVHPEHQGHGLGYAVCLAVLQRFAQQGTPEVRLLTDDHRLAAVRTYWRLGFRPLLTADDHAARWEAIRALQIY